MWLFLSDTVPEVCILESILFLNQFILQNKRTSMFLHLFSNTVLMLCKKRDAQKLTWCTALNTFFFFFGLTHVNFLKL